MVLAQLSGGNVAVLGVVVTAMVIGNGEYPGLSWVWEGGETHARTGSTLGIGLDALLDGKAHGGGVGP